jgi:hypothetical protein
MSWLGALPRALGRGLAWPVRRIARTRLRTKLALALSVAALLPMLVVASLASGVVLGSLDRGLQRDVERQLAVGLNLTLRAVERQGVDAVELAGHDELAAAVGQGEAAVREVLARAAPYLPSSVVQVFAADGRLLATEIVGGDAARFAELAVDARAATVAAGLAWSRRVTFELSAKGVVVRAVAPIVGRSLRLSGRGRGVGPPRRRLRRQHQGRARRRRPGRRPERRGGDLDGCATATVGG